MNPNHRLVRALSQLQCYVRASEWVGYDPYDLKAHPIYRRLQKKRLTAIPTKVAVNLFPLALRRLFKVKPEPHAKAMALFADAYLTLFDLTGNETYRTLAKGRLAWLDQHAESGFSGLAWGLPFDYQGRHWWPVGTPSVVVTAIAARAFLHAYKSLSDPAYLKAAVSICHFLAADIPRYEPDAERLCFSKLPAIQLHIHNANLMVAATLAMVGQAAGIDEWNLLARRAANYTLAEQRQDGAWYYWGPPDKLLYWIDHYHTGFVLRALDDLLRVTGWSDLSEPLKRGYVFYTRCLFDKGYIPRLTEAHRYPIDIHSCAEAILCLTQLGERYDDALARAQRVAEWTIANMRHPTGYFYYRRYRWLTIKIPYMRWGQAWMMIALARLQRRLDTVGASDVETGLP